MTPSGTGRWLDFGLGTSDFGPNLAIVHDYLYVYGGAERALEEVHAVWPAAPGEQQMMSHLDIAVENLEAGVAWALESGARLAEFQPQQDVRVMLDPAGHPFCLFPGPV